MEKYEYLICGSAGVNKFFMVDELPCEGKTVYFENSDFETLHFGGPGLNIALLLSTLSSLYALDSLYTLDRTYIL